MNNLQKIFSKQYSELPKELYLKEMERLAIDLSWKSSKLKEYNTLLETEQLINEKKTESGNSKVSSNAVKS